MPRTKRKNGDIEGIEEKLEFLGLDLDNVPEQLKEFEPLEYRVTRDYDEKQYKQYRFIDVKDIQILLSPTNRLTDLDEKYRKARPLYEYLDSENEDNVVKHATFLNMLKNMDIEEIKKIEKEQSNLNKEIPFKVKFKGNYLWQIYYSANTDKYFMIVPTEDTDYSAFFYVLKKQIESKRTSKIFVPISNIQYSSKLLKRNEFEDIENYLWLFTKDWPLIYEVYDKNDELSIQIIGETCIYEKIKTIYKIKLSNEKEASEFYKLLKALFILQTEIPEFFTFDTNIDSEGRLNFYLDGQRIEYSHMLEFIREEYKIGLKTKKELRGRIHFYNKKIKKLQELAAMQEIEYLAKEKQISTFLECKKSFFGKVKYFFKYSGKNNKAGMKKDEQEVPNVEARMAEQVKPVEQPIKERKRIPIKKIYTLEELIQNYKELSELEEQMKNLLMDINALKLKTKNLAKKIENATQYIEEIDSHKKSIFEFWKYSNKDEMSRLPEGEEEEINVVRKIEKTFNYEDDLEDFGKNLDKIQRKNLTKEDTDNIFIATTNLIDILNKIKTNTVGPDDIEKALKDLKSEAKELRVLNEEEYDIFGNMIEDSTKIRKINNKRHREMPKDKFSILEVNKNTKQIGFKLTLQEVIKRILIALDKGEIPQSLVVYKAINEKLLSNKEINVFNINPEKEMQEAVEKDGDNINLYKIHIKEGTKGIGFTNIIFYDNKNKTLPLGMDLSTKMIVDTAKLHLKLIRKHIFNVAKFEDEDDDFSKFGIKKVTLLEYEIVDLEDLEKTDKNENVKKVEKTENSKETDNSNKEENEDQENEIEERKEQKTRKLQHRNPEEIRRRRIVHRTHTED